ncbi:spore germination protein [Thermoactinomyces sp. DSM 45892]|uniref:spore germination protein n=1 Tax=Thermoactinomyces sp. DSM 45892 TaxID=1882753 RepID=UPI00089688EF|nr:spore germination protein [Thermoactinomyces sp. DSM 45892]SDY57574.1 spore germination protein KA/spore germination protein [Thermoactinomyces sp. DSM 45892]
MRMDNERLKLGTLCMLSMHHAHHNLVAVMYMKMRQLRFLRDQKRKKILEQHSKKKVEERSENKGISDDLDENLDFLKNVFGNSTDIITRTFAMKTPDHLKGAVIYIDEMVNKDITHNYILRPLMQEEIKDQTDIWKNVVQKLIEAGEVKEITKMKDVINGVLSGDTIFLLEGTTRALVIGTKGWTTRSVGEPRAESVVRGPREGLSETSTFSLAMIRHRFKDPDLRIQSFVIGERTQTAVSLLYVEGLTNEQIVETARNRLKDIKIDGILETGYLEEFLQDQTWTPFPQIQNTERPDSVVAHLLEGRIAILVDGSPHALIAPAVFTQFYNSPEDYYERYLISSFLRLIRLCSFAIALLLPAFYIAFVSFHPELIPDQLSIAMAAGRASVPFPSIVEALVMEGSIEVLREASIRLPGPIGPTIGIVGGLVIGTSAVQAGLVSPAIVIVVGMTTISSYANPSYNAAISIRLLRFPLMIAASILGLFGIMISLMLMVLHMVQIRSFGVPYMTPFAPFRRGAIRDTLVRVPWKYMNTRPSFLQPQDRYRQKNQSSEEAVKTGRDASNDTK